MSFNIRSVMEKLNVSPDIAPGSLLLFVSGDFFIGWQGLHEYKPAIPIEQDGRQPQAVNVLARA